MQHFGLEIIANVLHLDEDHPHVHQLYPAIYRNFVEVTNLSMSFVIFTQVWHQISTIDYMVNTFKICC